MDKNCWEICLELMQREMVPALGCTEPVSVALAAAKAVSLLGQTPLLEQIEVCVSRNILKNAMSVIIPGTDLFGTDYACALGAVGGDAERGLEVLARLDADAITLAKTLVQTGKVRVTLASSPEPVYIEALATGDGHTAKAIICGTHDHFIHLQRDEEILFHCETPIGQVQEALPEQLSLRSILEFAQQVPLERLGLAFEAVRLNTAISQDGLSKSYGLLMGKMMDEELMARLDGGTLEDHAMARTLAAVDARMAGCPLTVMSNSGSGNQGITATLPVWSIATDLHLSEETMIRAVAFSHMTAIYIKEHLDRLSSFCGAVVAAIGSSCAVTWLRGGDYDAVERTLINTLAGITGMICDGAKAGCALKVSAALNMGLQASSLALRGVRVAGIEGIVADEAEQTIDNLGRLTRQGMRETDKIILNIMLEKCAQ